MIINHNKITNFKYYFSPFLEMFICPNCHKRHEMATKVCSYECSKEYQGKLINDNKKGKGKHDRIY